MLRVLAFVAAALLSVPALAHSRLDMLMTAIPPMKSAPSDQCPATAPAEAQLAGFTTMVFCNDFTKPIPNTAGTGTTQDWLIECGPGTSAPGVWHGQWNTPWDCKNVRQEIDPLTGVLSMHFLVPQATNGRINLVTDDGTDHRPGYGKYFNYPQASLMEITYRDDIETKPGYCNGVDSTAFFAWSHEGGSGSSAVNEWDVVENWLAGIGCAPVDNDGAYHNWNTGRSGPLWGWSYCEGPCPPSVNTPGTMSKIHTFGLLITTDATIPRTDFCSYVDHVRINCGSYLYPNNGDVGAQCVGTGGPGGTPALNQSGCWGQRDIAIFWVGVNGSGNLSKDVNAWVQSFRVWSCPAWNAQDAEMSIPGVNTCYGKLVNY